MAELKVFEEKLDNGATVLINENNAAPVAACNFWFGVGAAYENEKEKGLSHIIEHMMFKGTEKRGVGGMDKEIKKMGGYNNAFTSYDATNYIIVIPSEHIMKALEVQYDALTSSVFDREELKKELNVILEELYRGKDSPSTFLFQELMKLSFEKRYHAPIIGYEKNIKSYTSKDVVDYYKKYYLPGNLVISISGDVKKEELLPYIKKTFGTMKTRRTGEVSYNADAGAGGGLKYRAIPGNIESRYLAVAFNIPDVVSGDIPSLEILARILGGTESSRLYRQLREEKQLVNSINSDVFSGKFGGLFIITAEVRKGKYAETLESIFKEIGRVRNHPVMPSETEKVKSDLIREHAGENMKVENIASALGYYETISDYRMYFDYNENLKRVIDTDVIKAAEKYLDPEAVNIVVYYPQKAEKEFEPHKKPENIKKFTRAASIKKKTEAGGVTMEKLDSGIKLIHRKITNTDAVAMRFVFMGGVIYEGGFKEGWYRGITNLMLDTMLKGTEELDAVRLAAEIDRLGAVFVKEIDNDNFGFAGEVINRNFEPFMELVSGIITDPAMGLWEMRKEKRDIINSIKNIKDRPSAYALKVFNEEFFEWHPYGYHIPGSVNSVKRIPLRYLKRWHKRYVTPNNLILSITGNIDKSYIKEVINRHFKGWKKGQNLKPDLPVRITREKRAIRKKINKKQSHVVIGFLGPKTNSKDYYAFRVFNNILSGGMDSRLFSVVRDKKNLCYSVYSTFDRMLDRGAFRIMAAASPKNEDELVDEVFKLLRNLRKNGVTKEEVRSAKNHINGMYKIGLQDYMARAESYAMYEFWGLGYKNVDWFMKKIKRVNAEDVNRVIRKYIKTGNYTMVIAGPEE